MLLTALIAAVRRLRPRIPLLALPILLASFLNAVNVWAEKDVRLDTDVLRLAWEQGDSRVAEWAVAASRGPEGIRWMSLATRDHAGRLLSRHLGLDGVEIEKGGWRQVKLANGLLLEGRSADGRLAIRQRVTPLDLAYRLRLDIELENLSNARLSFQHGVRLLLGPGLGEHLVKGFGIADTLYSFVEPVISVGGNVERTSLEEMDEPVPLFIGEVMPDWFGLHSRYFALLLAPGGIPVPMAVEAWSSSAETTDGLPVRYLPQLAVDLGITQLNAGKTIQREFLVFSGPKSGHVLHADEGDFSRLQFAGLWQWMRGLCIGLLWLLQAVYLLIPNWGVAIILLAVLVRLLMYPMARKILASQKAFAEVQKKIQPEMREIKQRYRGGEQSEKILELYERHGTSPLAGLKPLLIVLIQIPIFVALFHVLGQAYELRDASFLWIETLAEPDRLFGFGANLPFFGAYFNVLPVLLAVTTLLTIKLSPAPAADAASRRWQNIFLVLMAVGFFVLFYPFPSGMVLYWTMANVLHLVQQRLVEQWPAAESA